MKYLFLFLMTLLFIFSSCEKENVVVNTPKDNIETTAKAGGDCVFDDFSSPIRLFEFCGVEYAFQVSLQLVNHGEFHRIQGVAKCFKWGGDPEVLVDFADIELVVDGSMHIGCGIALDVPEPSDYNKNLVLGQVPHTAQCDDCGLAIVTLDYYKDVTMLPGDLLKANARIKMEGCGEQVVEFMTVILD